MHKDTCVQLFKRTVELKICLNGNGARFLMVRKIGVDRDESWRKVEIFSVTTNVYDTSTVPVRYRYESMTIRDGNATVNED